MTKLSGSAGKIAAEFTFPRSFIGFQGHFPGHPVLPGICLIQSALAAFESGEGCRFSLRTVVSAKFTGRVLPGETCLITILPGQPETNGRQMLRATVSRQGDRVATFKLTIEPVNGKGDRP